SLFGSIPAGAPVTRREPKDWPVPALGKVVRSTILDKVEQAKVSVVYHSPPQYAAGDAEMDLVGALLTQGKGSPLQRRLVLEEKLATEVSAYQQGSVLGGLFFIDVMASPGADLNRVETIVDEEVQRLSKDGPSAADLEARKATIEMGFLGRMDSVENVADKLNEYEYFFGEPDSFKRDLDRWRNATPAGVREWAGRVLTPGSRLVLRTLPQEPERAASARDERPTAQAVAEFRVPRPDGFTLENGLKVLVWNRPQVPLVSVNLLVRPEGAIMVSPAKAGLGQLTADMLEEGAGTRDAVAFSEAVQSLGADLSCSAGYDHFLVGLTALKRNLQPSSALLADAVLRPRFETGDFERVKRLHLEALEQEMSDPQAVASRAGLRYLLGDGHAYGTPASGSVATVTPLSLDDARALHAWAFSPANTTVLVSGDITTDEARTLVSGVFGSWTGTKAANPAPFDGPSQTFIPFDPRKIWMEGQGLKVAVVDRPDAVQTVLRLIIPNVNFADATRPYRRVLNAVVGGSFTSRLNQKLREELGYTYGAGSSFQMMAGGGLFIASTSVKADVTGPSVRELLHEISRVRGADITDAEGAKAQETVRTQIVQSLSGIHGPVAATVPYLVAGKAPAQLAEDYAEIQRATAFEINRLAGPAIPVERGVLVLVGDKKLILEQIKDLNLGVVTELNEQGVPIAPAPGAGAAKDGE
ncbi:MAG: insulinase family protein, partial [Phycisphaerales bacterium]|nr:insulinase family protein [Phycisphaerales bacterium]